MQLLDLFAGRAFRMGGGSNRRIVHPEMCSRRLTLNHGLHEPGQEFTQHLHDESEDMIVVLEGGGAVRQGDIYTPIEAHGTVNDTGAPARLISFQSPPDPALYAGERDHATGASPQPPAGHRSGVRILTLAKGGPAIGQPGDWRCVVSAAQGARQLGLDHIRLPAHQNLSHAATSAEEILVLIAGAATVQADGDRHPLAQFAVVFLQHGDQLLLTTDTNPVTLLRCYSLPPDEPPARNRMNARWMSNAKDIWDTVCADRLDQLERAHANIRGGGRGRQWYTGQLNRSLIVALVAQFQVYCRDLHDEAIDVYLAQANPYQAGVLETLLKQDRKLDRQNPRRSSLGSDFGRLGFDFIGSVRGRGRSTEADLSRLDELVE